MRQLRSSAIYSAIVVAAIVGGTTLKAAVTCEWIGTRGNWDNPTNWNGPLPSRTSNVIISSTKTTPTEVTLSGRDVLVNHLGIAEGGDSQSSFVLDGPSLTVIDTVDIGKYNGSKGRMLVKSGHVLAGTIFLSGGGGPGQRGEGTLEIEGGTLVTKNIQLGASAGSRCRLRMVGSKASGIIAEDGLLIGVYNYLQVEKEPPPSETDLEFNLDAEGVSPIFAWGEAEGRVNFPVPDGKGNGLGSCRLKIHLLAAPPSGDILLIGASHPCTGTFTGLPEGSAVRATFEGKTYEWKLTYRGGPKKCDIMLTDPRMTDTDGNLVAYATGQPAKKFQFDHSIVESVYRQFYQQADAQDPPAGGDTPAFPGAEGYGAWSKGGRGGRVIYVTNLLDSGPGSLRAAVEAKGPRTVIFRVGGIIETKGLVVHEPDLTIAGQTAPGDGICIKKAADVGGTVFELSGTHDVILRFLRFRAGNNTGNFRGDNLRATDSDSFIFDHCSCSWGNPETLSAAGSCDRYTVQWCIISEGCNQEGHAYASIIGGNRGTWHHNLFAHMGSRVPRWGDITVQCDFRNNVIYDWGWYCSYGDLRTLNYVNNYLRPGASTTQRYFIDNPKVVLPNSMFVNGNFIPGHSKGSADNWLGVNADRSLQSATPFPAPPVQTQSAPEAFDLVLKNAGATLPKRDSVDTRVISDARNGTGKIINDENEVGGWPTYASGKSPVDTVNDGIPDDWKRAHGLALNQTNIANAINADGYTELEEYLNSLVKP